MTMTKTLSLLGFFALAGCSMMKGKGDDTGGGGGGGEKALADNMADAQVFTVGDSLTTELACHGSGYMKIDAPPGEAFQIEVTVQGPEGACFDLAYLNSNGGSQNGGQMFGEKCESTTLDVTGLEGGAYIQVGESGVCKTPAATVEIALK